MISTMVGVSRWTLTTYGLKSLSIRRRQVAPAMLELVRRHSLVTDVGLQKLHDFLVAEFRRSHRLYDVPFKYGWLSP